MSRLYLKVPHIRSIKFNAYFYEKRKEQNQFWMLQTIEEQLKMQFYNNPNIVTLLEEHKKAVQNDLISPFAAAQSLLNIYLKKQ